MVCSLLFLTPSTPRTNKNPPKNEHQFVPFSPHVIWFWNFQIIEYQVLTAGIQNKLPWNHMTFVQESRLYSRYNMSATWLCERREERQELSLSSSSWEKSRSGGDFHVWLADIPTFWTIRLKVGIDRMVDIGSNVNDARKANPKADSQLSGDTLLSASEKLGHAPDVLCIMSPFSCPKTQIVFVTAYTRKDKISRTLVLLLLLYVG